MCDIWRPRPSRKTVTLPPSRSSVVGENNVLGLSTEDAQDDCEVHEVEHMAAHQTQPNQRPMALSPEQDNSLLPPENDEHPQADPLPPETMFETPPAMIETQSRGRIVLSVALLIQVRAQDVQYVSVIF